MRIDPRLLFLFMIGVIVVTDQFAPVMEVPYPWLRWAGGVFAVLGIGVSVAAKRQFRRAGTNVYTFEEPGELVVDGLYSMSRNPMYLGLVLAGAGAAMLSATLVGFLLWVAFVSIVRFWYIAFEEHAMQEKFGSRYEEYCRSVPRWLGRRRPKP